MQHLGWRTQPPVWILGSLGLCVKDLTRIAGETTPLFRRSGRPFAFYVLQDDPGTPSPDGIQQALTLHTAIMKLASAEAESGAEIEKEQLSFHLAASLPLDLDLKQALLGMKSEAERLRAVISFF